MGKPRAAAKRSKKAREVPEAKGPVVEHVRMDLNRYALEHIIPGAVEMCDEGILREKKLERDAKWDGKPVYWLAEVEHGVWETTSALPYGIPAIRMRGNPEGANGIRFQMAHQFIRFRVCRVWGDALKLAREMDFRYVGTPPDIASVLRKS